ncbi:MAG: hypothetical protein KGH81_06945 [Thaumarchaeota archaeon]|nr:hypothetical protein [Nitrososphaerota archaeon]
MKVIHVITALLIVYVMTLQIHPSFAQNCCSQNNFTIQNKTTTYHNTNMSNAHMKIESPLKQFKEGIALKDIKCENDFQMIIRAEDHSPACVKPAVVHILVERGWGINPQSLEAKLLLAHEYLDHYNASKY